MFRYLLVALSLLVCSVGNAAGIPSSVSGLYTTPTGACALVYSNDVPEYTHIEIACVGTAPLSSIGNATLFGTCPTSSFPMTFDQRAGPESRSFAVLDFTATTLTVVISTSLTNASNAVGTVEVWNKRFNINPQNPYVCAPTKFDK